jgi:membrane protease YdiL (CAAX protease family)
VLDPAPELSSVPHDGPTETAGPPVASSSPRRTLPIERLGAFIEVLLCSGFPTQLLVFGALTGFGMHPRTADGGWSPPFVVTMSLVDMVLVIGLVCLFLRAHHESLAEFLLGGRRIGREVLLGILLIPAAFVLVVLVLGALLTLKPELQNVLVNPFEQMLKTPRTAAIFAFVVTFAGGLREEIQRGFIIRRFDQYLGGAVVGIVLFSAVFGLGHLDQGYAAAIAIGVLGAAWGCLYWIRRSVVAPVVSHAGFNLAQLLKYVILAT